MNEALGWIGSRVDDIYGVAIGRLEDVWIDPATGEPRWLLVKEGRFGGRSTLVPFEDATAGEDSVWIPYERDVVREAPQVEPAVPLTQQVEATLRNHYAANAAAAVSHHEARGPGREPAPSGAPEQATQATVRLAPPAWPEPEPTPPPPLPERPAPPFTPPPGREEPAPGGPRAHPGPEQAPASGAAHQPPEWVRRPQGHEGGAAPGAGSPYEPPTQPYRPQAPQAPQTQQPPPEQAPPAPPPQAQQRAPTPEQQAPPAQQAAQQPPPQAPQAQQPPPQAPQAQQPPPEQQAAQAQQPPPQPPAPDPLEALAGLPPGYQVEIELTGGVSISGELRSIRIVPPASGR